MKEQKEFAAMLKRGDFVQVAQGNVQRISYIKHENGTVILGLERDSQVLGNDQRVTVFREVTPA